MSVTELQQVMNRSKTKNKAYYKAQITIHRRFSIPVACLALGLLAFPLGVQSKLGKRSFGLVLCLFFFLLYYLLLTAGYALGKKGIYPPVIGMWLPNVTMAVIGVYFLLQVTKEKTLKIEHLLQHLVQLISRLRQFKGIR
jgi:lipopolysaccharide export system permease protein